MIVAGSGVVVVVVVVVIVLGFVCVVGVVLLVL